MSELKTSALFVELDCLVDTRLSVLKSFGEEAFFKAFDENYYNRVQDRFNGINTDDFMQRYRMRDKRILKEAAATSAVQFVLEFVKTTNDQVLSSPFQHQPKIIINTYPYQLTEEESNHILKAFVILTKRQSIVEIVHMSPEEITPRFVKQNLSILMMYHYHEWLDLHSANENFKKTTCPDVTLIGPALFFKDLPTAAELKEVRDMNISPFKVVEIVAGPLIQLTLMPVELFSLALKIAKANTSESSQT